MSTMVLFDQADNRAGRLCGRLSRTAELVSEELILLDANEASMKACIGCFGCWIKSPGVCVLQEDRGPDFLSTLLKADRLLFLSAIQWGGYSTLLKYYADRMLPLLHPYFRRLNGEMHHKQRYAKNPQLLALGYAAATAAEHDCFMEYTQAQRDNIGGHGKQYTWIWPAEKSLDDETATASLQTWFATMIQGGQK